MVGLGSALGLSGTTLGILAAPLAVLRSALDPTISRRLKGTGRPHWRERRTELQAGLQGGRGDGLSHRPTSGVSAHRPCRRPGLCLYGAGPRALAVAAGRSRFLDDLADGRMVLRRGWGYWPWPRTAALALWPRAVWNRRLVVVGAAMIYCSYALTYSARTIMLKEGLWTEPQLLYMFASRYHVLPLLGLVTIVAAFLLPGLVSAAATRGAGGPP